MTLDEYSYTEAIRDSHAIVWRYRDELQEVWPTPDATDALRFAFTEAAEAMDANLRLNSGYARNNDKTLSVDDELADCAMMLLTAVGPEWNPFPVPGYVFLHPARLDNICCDVAHALEGRDIVPAIESIAVYLGADNLPARITARLERIKAKRLGNRE